MLQPCSRSIVSKLRVAGCVFSIEINHCTIGRSPVRRPRYQYGFKAPFRCDGHAAPQILPSIRASLIPELRARKAATAFASCAVSACHPERARARARSSIRGTSTFAPYWMICPAVSDRRRSREVVRTHHKQFTGRAKKHGLVATSIRLLWTCQRTRSRSRYSDTAQRDQAPRCVAPARMHRARCRLPLRE